MTTTSLEIIVPCPVTGCVRRVACSMMDCRVSLLGTTRLASHVTHHTSRIISHVTHHITHHTSHHTSRITSHVTHRITRHASHVTHHITRHSSHVTHYTTHATHHPSHFRHYTSHITHHTLHVFRHACYSLGNNSSSAESLTHRLSMTGISSPASHVTRHTSRVTRHTSHVTLANTCLSNAHCNNQRRNIITQLHPISR